MGSACGDELFRALDRNGNGEVTIDEFIDRFKETTLHDLVKNKKGCYAVSGFEIIENVASAYVDNSMEVDLMLN